MKNQIKKIRLYFFILHLSFLVSSCITGNYSVPETIQPRMESTLPARTPTHSPTITSVPLPIQTSALTPTSSNTATSTFTPDPTQTMTPLPTLSSDAAIEMVNELFVTNRGCLLPCWWGFIPGQTSWGETKQFLEQFAEFNGLVDQTKPSFYIRAFLKSYKEG
jgi:cytoskeletal protein RodZ